MQSLNSKRVNLILGEVTQWASYRADIVAAHWLVHRLDAQYR